MPAKFASIDDYVASLPAQTRPVVEEVRRRILRVVPQAEETIKYQMPTMTLDGSSLVHFAAWKKHLSLYPAPAVTDDPEFESAFAPHRGEKGTAAFSYADPIPYDLIERMVGHLLAQRSASEGGGL